RLRPGDVAAGEATGGVAVHVNQSLARRPGPPPRPRLRPLAARVETVQPGDAFAEGHRSVSPSAASAAAGRRSLVSAVSLSSGSLIAPSTALPYETSRHTSVWSAPSNAWRPRSTRIFRLRR